MKGRGPDRAPPLDDRGDAGDRPAGDKRVDLVRAFVGVDGLGIREDLGHLKVGDDAVAAEDFPRAIEQHATINDGIKAAGYRFVALDLAGFRSGSLNGATANSVVIPMSDLLTV